MCDHSSILQAKKRSWERSLDIDINIDKDIDMYHLLTLPKEKEAMQALVSNRRVMECACNQLLNKTLTKEMEKLFVQVRYSFELPLQPCPHRLIKGN